MKLLGATLVLFVMASATALVPATLNKPIMAQSQSAVVAGCTETNEAIADLEEAIKQARAAVQEHADPGQPPIDDLNRRSIPECRSDKSAVLAHYREQENSWKERSVVDAIHVAQAFLLLTPLMIVAFYLATRMRSGKDAARLKVLLPNRLLGNFSLLAVFVFFMVGYATPMLKANEARAEFLRINGFAARESHLYAPFMISVDGYEPGSGIGFHGPCTRSTRFFVLPWRLLAASNNSFCPI